MGCGSTPSSEDFFPVLESLMFSDHGQKCGFVTQLLLYPNFIMKNTKL